MIKENKKIWHGIGAVILVITVVAAFIIAIYGIAMSGRKSTAQVFDAEWTVFKCMSGGRQSSLVVSDMTEANFKKVDKGTKLIATARIPNGGIDGITLQMCLKRVAYNIEIEGTKIASYDVGRYLKKQAIGNGYHFINIAPRYYGKKVTVKLYMDKRDSYENIREMSFLDGSNAEINLASKNFSVILLCSFLVVFGGIISLIGAIFFFKENYAQFLYIGFYSFLIGLYVLSSRYLLQIFNSDLLTNTFLEYFTMFLIPIPVMLFSLAVMSDKRKVYRYIMRLYVVVDVAVTIMAVIGYFFYNLHFNRISGYYRMYMIAGLAFLFIAQFRKMFTASTDKLRLSGFWVLIISNTVPLFSFVFYKNMGAFYDFTVYLMPVGNIYLILVLLYSYLMNYMRGFKDDVERKVLMKMAYTDSMTGLFNRACSMEKFEIMDRENAPYCIAWFDLNYLKRTNDRYGHEEGDMLITRFAAILKEVFEDIGTVCRMGGDEFCVIMDISMNDKRITKKIDRMQKLIDEENKMEHKYFMQTSYGVAGSEEFEAPSTDAVCSAADKRMYEMKVSMKAQRTD